MMRVLKSIAFVIITTASVPCAAQEANSTTTAQDSAAQASAAQDFWHQWRGPNSTGVAPTADPPTTWSETENVQWKASIDGQGSSTPIIWQDKVFLLTAINTGKVDESLPKPEDQPKRVFGITHPNTYFDFVTLCLDRNTGKEIWRKTATTKVPHEGHHGDNDFASASPVTDGQRLFCWFGSAGLFCYDLDGELLWKRDLGKAHMGASLGEGCSPVLHHGKLIIVRDQARQSTIEVLDAATGKTAWKKDRDEPNAWATPLVIQAADKTQVITAASNFVRSYDLQSGDVIWQCSGLTGNVIPCPVTDGELIYCMSGYEGESLLAIRPDGTGDISGSDKVIWKAERNTPYIPSPLLYDDRIYLNKSNQAIVSIMRASTGEVLTKASRLSGLSNLYASPIGASGRIYITGRAGTTLVFRLGDDLEQIAANELDDRFDSSGAIAGDQLFLRGSKHLYCLSQ